MALGECMPLDLFGGGNMIDLITSSDGEKDQVYESKYILKTLREVNEDDTLSRVLCSDSMPNARVMMNSDRKLTFSADQFTKLNEEVTLCTDSSHVDSVMSECISDGIEATDIGSLLEQYEKAISPALSPAMGAFLTPVPSPGNEIELMDECIMTDIKGQPLISSDISFDENLSWLPSVAAQPTIDGNKLDSIMEFPDTDIFIDNQVIISTSSEEEETIIDVKTEMSDVDSVVEVNLAEKTKNVPDEVNRSVETLGECKVRNKNGIVVVEFTSTATKTAEVNEKTIDNEEPKVIKTRLQSVIGKSYTIPKRQKDSKTRARSRSPHMTFSQRSSKTDNKAISSRSERSKSRGYSTNSDDEEREERYQRYRSERRTPARKDDSRKRRKYSSCSDDEYDYYRYSRKRTEHFSDQRNRQCPERTNYEHDYNRVSDGNRNSRYQRSNSMRERGSRSRDLHRNQRPRNNKHQDETKDDNVHERLAELATPVPYDIERERKIGFLCQGKGPKASLERRNVYAGGIHRRVSRLDLFKRFEIFGPIEDITLHFREKGDSYAFIVFEDPKDAVRAVQDGNNDPNFDRLDLCFGGRRKFVGGSYVDFDANTSYLEENDIASSLPPSPTDESEFDALLKMARKKQTV